MRILARTNRNTEWVKVDYLLTRLILFSPLEESTMAFTEFRGSLKWILVVAILLGGGALAQAQFGAATQAEDQPAEGKIVRIGPAGDGDIVLPSDAVDQTEQPETPKHWIGILGGPVNDAVRAQIDIPADQGVLVRQVVPESPADKAGLKVFDILLKANDRSLTDVADLTDLVRSQGENGGQIALDVLRRGEHQAITITPEVRPERAAGFLSDTLPGQDPQGFGFGGMGPGRPQFGFRQGGPMQLNAFGPGMATQQSGLGLSQMPNGVSVSIQKKNDEPAHITVQRGNDTWNIVGDDPSSLAQLPDDVRPFVEQLLAGGGQMSTPMTMPMMPVIPSMPRIPAGFDDDAMQQRMHQLEQNLQELQQRMQGQFGQPQLIVPAEPDADNSNSDESSPK